MRWLSQAPSVTSRPFSRKKALHLYTNSKVTWHLPFLRDLLPQFSGFSLKPAQAPMALGKGLLRTEPHPLPFFLVGSHSQSSLGCVLPFTTSSWPCQGVLPARAQGALLCRLWPHSRKGQLGREGLRRARFRLGSSGT